MSDKLKELTERIYNDGVKKAQQEALVILEDAENTRNSIILAAKDDARKILEEGRKSLETLRVQKNAELVLSARQAESALKQKFVNLLADAVLSSGVPTALEDTKLFIHLIRTAVDNWAAGIHDVESKLILSKDLDTSIREQLTLAIKEKIERGLVVVYSKELSSGFRIESRNGRYSMGFSDEDFKKFFLSFIKEETRNLLFGDK